MKHHGPKCCLRNINLSPSRITLKGKSFHACVFDLLVSGVVKYSTRGLNGTCKLEFLSLSGGIFGCLLLPFGRDWLLDKISFVIPECILLQMSAAPFSLNPLAEDMIVWAFSSNEVFSLNSTYSLAKDLNPLNISLEPDSSWIWKANTTPRIKYFLWLCFHHSLPTCEVLGLRA